jgi:hypothetical protein
VRVLEISCLIAVILCIGLVSRLLYQGGGSVILRFLFLLYGRWIDRIVPSGGLCYGNIVDPAISLVRELVICLR